MRFMTLWDFRGLAEVPENSVNLKSKGHPQRGFCWTYFSRYCCPVYTFIYFFLSVLCLWKFMWLSTFSYLIRSKILCWLITLKRLLHEVCSTLFTPRLWVDPCRASVWRGPKKITRVGWPRHSDPGLTQIVDPLRPGPSRPSQQQGLKPSWTQDCRVFKIPTRLLGL